MSVGGDDKKKAAVIDLFADDSDDDDADLFQQKTPIFTSSKRKSPDSVLGSKSFFKDEKPAAVTSVSASQNPHRKFIGHFVSSVLDAQHFPAPAKPSDKVTLLHEPNNMFDQNAIKVLVSSGGKLGMLPRNHASIVCPMLTTLSHKIALQATILTVSNDRRKIRIVVDVYVHSSHELTPEEIQETRERIRPSLEKLEWTTGQEPGSFDQLMKETDALSDEALAKLAREVAQGKALPQSPELAFLEEEGPADIDMSLLQDWESQQQELDKMFEEIQLKQLENLPDIPMPKQFEHMNLYDYQKNGIRWLYNQEKSGQLPSWFERRNNKWLCTVTGLQQMKDPHPVRGSLLADDMGLGVRSSLLAFALSFVSRRFWI